MESVFPVSRDVYAGQYRPASLQANPQHIWQQHRRTAPIGTQAYKEPASHPSPSGHEAWKQQVDTLSRIIMRQEGHFVGLEDEVKTSKREIQRLGYLAEARNQHIQHLEHQLAQTEAKNQQLTHEVFVLRHTVCLPTLHLLVNLVNSPLNRNSRPNRVQRTLSPHQLTPLNAAVFRRRKERLEAPMRVTNAREARFQLRAKGMERKVANRRIAKCETGCCWFCLI